MLYFKNVSLYLVYILDTQKNIFLFQYSILKLLLFIISNVKAGIELNF